MQAPPKLVSVDAVEYIDNMATYDIIPHITQNVNSK